MGHTHVEVWCVRSPDHFILRAIKRVVRPPAVASHGTWRVKAAIRSGRWLFIPQHERSLSERSVSARLSLRVRGIVSVNDATKDRMAYRNSIDEKWYRLFFHTGKVCPPPRSMCHICGTFCCAR